MTGEAPLTIDPVLSYVKTFGRAGSNIANLVTTDAQGNIYAAGQSNGGNFPTTPGSFEPSTIPHLAGSFECGTNDQPAADAHAGFSVGAVGATPDGGILYARTSQGILLALTAVRPGSRRLRCPSRAGRQITRQRSPSMRFLSIR